MNDWNIQSRAHACSACAQAFADQAVYHTALFEDAEGLHRHDVCRTCWEAGVQAQLRARPGFLSHWQGVYEVPPPPTESIQKENAETLLRKLVEQDDPRFIPAAYILAVMLERKRLLKVKEEVQREGRRVFVYEHAKNGEVLTIVDPALQLDQLESVQREVSQLLEQGFPAGPGVASVPDPSGSPAAEGEAEPVGAEGGAAQPG